MDEKKEKVLCSEAADGKEACNSVQFQFRRVVSMKIAVEDR